MAESNAVRSHSGLACVALVARLLGIGVSTDELAHAAGKGADEDDALDVLRALRGLGLKAREARADWRGLADLPLPAIARHRDGRWFLIIAYRRGRVLVQEAFTPRPAALDRAQLEAAWCGRLILVTRRAAPGDAARRFGFAWFLPTLLRYRKLLGEVLLASLFVQLFALTTPLFFQVMIDKVLVHRGLTTLDVLATGMLVVALFEVALGALRTYVFSHTTNRVDVQLGANIFRHLMSLPLAYFEARRTGDSVARVRELENIRTFLTGTSVTVAIDVLFTAVFLAVMACYSRMLLFIVLGALPLYVLLSVLVTPLLRARLEEKFSRGAENHAFLVESVSGMQTLKAMAVEPQLQRHWEEQLAGYVRSAFRATTLGNAAGQGASLINKVTTVLVLWFGARLVMQGAMTVGQLVAFNMLAARVSGPVLRLVQLWQDFQQAGISVRRVGDILNCPPEAPLIAGRSSPSRIEGRITFDHVTFRYRPEAGDVLHDLSVDIPSGQVLGIVGPSGSGKSTLTRLVQRLYVPQAGRVLIDGIDLALINPSWLRRQLGVVLQESVLFSRSIRENIALADPGMPIERVVHAARLAGAHDFILELPDGYDTQVGEHGSTLSGGQRQRIALARALVTDPRILILDEATSALDYQSERVIQDNMKFIAQGRTVLIVAHRLSAVRHAARIIVLDQGRLTEEGRHEQLVRKGGRYAGLYAYQLGRSG